MTRVEHEFASVRKLLDEGGSYPEIVLQISAFRDSLTAMTEVIVHDLVTACIAQETGKSLLDAVSDLEKLMVNSR